MTSLMYDSTRPQLIPASALYAAVYINGKYAADPQAVQARLIHARVFEIDVLGTAPGASVKDVERGDLNPADIPRVVGERYARHPDSLTRIYCNLDTWPAARQQVATLPEPQRDTIRYWIADPTGIQHFVAGLNATQYKWGDDYDTSIIGPNFIGGQ